MAERAAHLVDHVLPPVPFRQWVLSLPYALRYRMAYDHELCRAVLAVMTRALMSFQRRRAKKLSITDPHTGTVTVVQRFGSGLRLNVHFHTLLPDGVFVTDETTGATSFIELPPPTDDEVARLVLTIARRIARLLERRGLLTDPYDDQADEAPALAALQQASIRGVRALGPEAGRLVARLRNPALARPAPSDRPLHAHLEGFDLHAAVAIDADDRDALERLCRYLGRPAIAQDHLKQLDSGQVRVELRHPWSDGTTHLDFTPHELIGRLAAFVPRPRVNLVLYHGVFAPNAKHRSAVVSYGREAEPAPAADNAAAQPNASPPRYWAWADLMRRAVGIDVPRVPGVRRPHARAHHHHRLQDHQRHPRPPRRSRSAERATPSLLAPLTALTPGAKELVHLRAARRAPARSFGLAPAAFSRFIRAAHRPPTSPPTCTHFRTPPSQAGPQTLLR